MNRTFHAIASSLIATLFFAAPAVAAGKVDAALVGRWSSPMGGGYSLVLTLDGSGRCTIDEEQGTCTASGGKLSYQSEEAGLQRYSYKLAGRTLTLSGGDLDGPVKFSREGSAAAAEVVEPSAAAAVAEPEPPQKKVTQSGPGATLDDEAWGVRFTGPKGWKFVQKMGTYLGGHDTEGGLMLIRFYPTATRNQIVAEFQKGVAEAELTASPTGSMSAWKKGSASGLSGQMTGALSTGQPAKVRVIAVQSAHGGALGVMGVTTPEHFDVLSARVEQLAATVTFKKPKAVKNPALAGSYWFYTGSGGGYSRERKLFLCTNGTFRREGELYGSGSSGTAFAANGDSGTWSADASTLTLRYAEGSTQEIPFRVSTDPKDKGGYGQAVIFGSDKYQKTGAGNCD